jgi:fatty acid desaturase
MALLDLYWRLEALAFVLQRVANSARYPWAWWHLLQLMAHYVLLVQYALPSWGALPVFMLLRGFLTGTTVFTSHYAEEHLSAERAKSLSLAEQTALTARNVAGGDLMNFYTGFISLQIEHHLFPRMPTSGLATVQPLVRVFFAKHGMEYLEDSLAMCLHRNMQALKMDYTKPAKIE